MKYTGNTLPCYANVTLPGCWEQWRGLKPWDAHSWRAVCRGNTPKWTGSLRMPHPCPCPCSCPCSCPGSPSKWDLGNTQACHSWWSCAATGALRGASPHLRHWRSIGCTAAARGWWGSPPAHCDDWPCTAEPPLGRRIHLRVREGGEERGREGGWERFNCEELK